MQHFLLFKDPNEKFFYVEDIELDYSRDQLFELQYGVKLEVEGVGLSTYICQGKEEFVKVRMNREKELHLSPANRPITIHRFEEAQSSTSERQVLTSQLSTTHLTTTEIHGHSAAPPSTSESQTSEPSSSKVLASGKRKRQDDDEFTTPTKKGRGEVNRLDEMQEQLDQLSTSISQLSRTPTRPNSRNLNKVIHEGAIVEINGEEKNVADITNGEFNTLLEVHRQSLGEMPSFAGIPKNKIVDDVGPVILKLFKEGKYGQMASFLAGFLIEKEAFHVSFLMPLVPNLGRSEPKQSKRKLNKNFEDAIRFFALYYGGCVLQRNFQPIWLGAIRDKFNAKVNNHNGKKNKSESYAGFPGLTPPFNLDNAF
uniref:BEN domain-containing protein n=1 Tax=Panagrolaimus sp. ES5 TaxID=591445 RepID=A0AC34FN37_9BILA